MARRLVPRLPHLGRQSKVAAQLLRRQEARHVADRGQHRRGDHRTDARDGHQTPCTRVVERLLRQDFVELCHLGGDTLKLSHQAPQHSTLLIGQRQAVEPLASSLAEEMPVVLRDQIRVQDCLNAPFQPNRLFKNAHPLGNLAPAFQGILVGDPHFRQKTCCVQASEDSGVNFVGLDPGIGNRPNQARISYGDTFYVWPHQPLDGGAVAGCLNDDLVLQAERPGEVHHGAVDEINPQFSGDLSVLQDRHLSERPMDVHTGDTHSVPPIVQGSQRACTTSTDPRSQRSRASRRGGHVTTRARSSC